jgi:hypothetical protein
VGIVDLMGIVDLLAIVIGDWREGPRNRNQQ